MIVILYLVVISLVLALGFLGAFVWALKSGQYDDDYTPSVRMLFDDKKKKKSESSTTINT
jgi:cbb3-type cytochrome oxidase maturation protein